MKTVPDALEEALGESPSDAEFVSALADALPTHSPAASLRERLLASAASPPLRWAPLFDKLGTLFDLDDAALMHLAERAATPSEWQAGPLPAVHLLHLQGGPAIAGADAGLVRVEGGVHFPEHRHLGEERTLILEGEALESSGLTRRPGDALSMPAESSHSFEVAPGRALIYAVVLFGGVEIGGVRL